MNNRKVIIELLVILCLVNIGFTGWYFFSSQRQLHLSVSDSFSYEWLRTWGGAYSSGDYDDPPPFVGRSITLDSSNNIYIAGNVYYFPDSATFREDGGSALFLVKYDSSGAQIWNLTRGGRYYDDFETLLLDSDGFIYLAGSSIDFFEGASELYLVKFDETGKLLWNRTWSSRNNAFFRPITLDSKGNIYLVENMIINEEMTSVTFLIKYNSFGIQLWNRTWDGSENVHCNAIALDLQDNIYLTGQKVNILDETITDLLLLKFNHSGNLQWTHVLERTVWDYCNTIKLDSQSNIYLAGGKYDNILGRNTIILLSKYDTSGELLWNRIWSGSDRDYCSDIALDSEGNIYLVGSIQSQNFARDSDALLLKFNNFGILHWSNTWGGYNEDIGYDITLDSSDNVYITGVTSTYATVMFLMKIPNSYVMSISGYEPLLFLAIASVITMIVAKKRHTSVMDKHTR